MLLIAEHVKDDSPQQDESLFIEFEDKHDDLKNAVDCLQSEFDRINIISHSNDEKISKMNHQLHVLSAMFVEFNTKINTHLLDFNRRNNKKIEAGQIIDKHTLPFMDNQQNHTRKNPKTSNDKPPASRSEIKVDYGSHPKTTKNAKQQNPSKVIDAENQFSSDKSAINRFVKEFSRSAHSKTIDVRIHGTAIHNLSAFALEFQKRFERVIGKNTINIVSILKYKLTKGVITQIDVNVSFRVPLSSNYLNDFMFPANWTFFEINMRHIQQQRTKNPARQQHKHTEKTPAKRQHTQTAKTKETKK